MSDAKQRRGLEAEQRRANALDARNEHLRTALAAAQQALAAERQSGSETKAQVAALKNEMHLRQFNMNSGARDAQFLQHKVCGGWGGGGSVRGRVGVGVLR